MDQENNFLKFYESLSQEDIDDEINTLNNIKLSVDFWEYIATDPEKLLAIIHYNNLEDKYGIKITFNNVNSNCTGNCTNCTSLQNPTGLQDATGNMIIIFRFNNDIYHISTMIDSVTNTNIYDSFVEQILFLLNNHRSEIISREEKYLASLEKTIKERYNTSVNLLWYIMNSPQNIKEVIAKIDSEMNKEAEQDKHCCEHCEHCEQCEQSEEIVEKKTDICPILTIIYSMLCFMIIKYLEYAH
ncbi:MAG: hypothetical protein IJ997_01080 [Mycoplasmataceae bacterium]|nr:hypothetical protein [Mycoplasmataceae bacterium]